MEKMEEKMTEEKITRLRNLKICLAAEEWGSKKERKKWIAEKEQLEQEGEELKADIEHWKREMSNSKLLMTFQTL